MNFCKKTNDNHICTAPSAKAQALCIHCNKATWEVFCQWCWMDNDGQDICGLGESIYEAEKEVSGSSRKWSYD
jgi:hypothetical protein